jgi:single-strand DNA-binding protein
MNSITIVGRAGRDPEVKFLDGGKVVAKLSLASNGWSKEAETNWFDLEIWGKQAQVAADYVKKGSQIGVVGTIKTEAWTDKTTGQKRTKQVVNVNTLQLLGSKPAGNAPAPEDEEVPF